MPLMSGIELGRRIQQCRATTKLAFMSGFIPAGEPNHDYLQDHPYIQKPFSHAELLRLVQNVLAH
jgi:FixJ family two-component response regulator